MARRPHVARVPSVRPLSPSSLIAAIRSWVSAVLRFDLDLLASELVLVLAAGALEVEPGREERGHPCRLGGRL